LTPLAFMGIGTGELIVILVVVVLLFGAKRIPEIAKGLGRASHEFKKAKDDLARESKELTDNAQKLAEAEDKTQKQAYDKSEKPDAG